MARMTRALSQADTRAKLIEAARVAFARNGVRGTSIDQIAEAAGFSKGAFYSNFSSKEDLALAATYDDVRPRLDAWAAMLIERAREGPEAVAATLRAGAEAVEPDQDRDRLHLELLLQGSRQPELGAVLREQFTRSGERIRDALRLVFALLGRHPPLDVGELANLILLIHYGRKNLEIAAVPHAAGQLTEVIFRALFATAEPMGVR